MLDRGLQYIQDGEYDKAVQVFCMMLGIDESDHVARAQLAYCYYLLEKFELGKEQFEILSHCDHEVCSIYGLTMLATMDGLFMGNFDFAIKTLRKLKLDTTGIINLANIYIKKYNATKQKNLLDEAKLILDDLIFNDVPETFHWRLYLTLGITYQKLKQYKISERCYNKALKAAFDDNKKGKILNEVANLYIATNNPKAKEVLDEALSMFKEENVRGIAYNKKYRAKLELKKGNYQIAKGLLTEASKVYIDKGILTELEEVNFLLAKIEDLDDNSYKKAEIFAEAVFIEE